jgi:hypothetical protein
MFLSGNKNARDYSFSAPELTRMHVNRACSHKDSNDETQHERSVLELIEATSAKNA